MDRLEESRIVYRSKRRKATIAFFIGFVLTVCISVSVILTGFKTVEESAMQATQEVDKEYETLMKGYIKIFQTMLIPIQQKILPLMK